MNGGIEAPANLEVRYLAPSPSVATYDQKPEMSSQEVTQNLVNAINTNEYDLIIANYANPDMVGHTGDLQAAIKACESVDSALIEITQAIHEIDGSMIICADHGNCETMVNIETGNPHTAHTTNPVPVILVDKSKNIQIREGGKLADIAPTLLELMGLNQPIEMTGRSLIS